MQKNDLPFQRIYDWFKGWSWEDFCRLSGSLLVVVCFFGWVGCWVWAMIEYFIKADMKEAVFMLCLGGIQLCVLLIAREVSDD